VRLCKEIKCQVEITYKPNNRGRYGRCSNCSYRHDDQFREMRKSAAQRSRKRAQNDKVGNSQKSSNGKRVCD